MGEWIMPFKGRGNSLAVDQNLLWKSGNVYVMDNHRAALWCWMQEIDLLKKFRLYHIDAHYDCAGTPGDEWMESIPDIRNLSFSDYLSLHAHGVHAFRWDNYLSIFFAKYNDQLAEIITSTHLLGTRPAVPYAEELPHEFPSTFRDGVVGGSSPEQWIINLDLDYFFCHLPEKTKTMFSVDYSKEIFCAVRDGMQKNRFAVITVCLSPECCGGWPNAEKMCARLCKILELDFELPRIHVRRTKM